MTTIKTKAEWLQEFQTAFDQARLNYKPNIDPKTGKERRKQNVGLGAVKEVYRKGTLTTHPDMGGSNEAFIALKDAYDVAVKKLTTQGTQFSGEEWVKPDGTNFWQDHMMQYKGIIDQLLPLEGLILEIKGTWLWVSGKTRQHKDALKAIDGLLYSGGKKMWFASPSGKKRRRSSRWTMDQINATYGNHRVTKDDDTKPKQNTLKA